MAAITIITSGRGSVGTMYSAPCPGTVVSDGAGSASNCGLNSGWGCFWETRYSSSELQDGNQSSGSVAQTLRDLGPGMESETVSVLVKGLLAASNRNIGIT